VRKANRVLRIIKEASNTIERASSECLERWLALNL
jgi:hypothetical protein